MSNKLQLLRTTDAGKVPTIADMLDGELALNSTDKNWYVRMGSDIVHMNAASSVVQDSTHRFVTDAQISSWDTPYTLPIASASVLGGVKIGQNITIDGDGTIHIPNATNSVSGILTSTDWATFNGKQNALGYTPVDKAGDTMLGALVLAANPTTALEAATKQYTDDGLATKVSLAGDTMTGFLTLSGDPTAGLHAATKQYVDLGLSTIGGRYAAPVADKVELSGLASASLADRQLRLVESNGTIYRYDVQSTDTPDAEGVIIPDDITAPAPGRWIKVQAAMQNHNLLTGLQGGSTGDYLHITTAEKNSYDGHLTDTALHLTPAQNTLIDSISASATEINYLVGVTSAIQGQLDGKQADLGYTPVNKAGDTMLGFLTLFADPTAAGHAVTKNYTDNMIIDCGTF
jgi:hypothetical protein